MGKRTDDSYIELRAHWLNDFETRVKELAAVREEALGRGDSKTAESARKAGRKALSALNELKKKSLNAFVEHVESYVEQSELELAELRSASESDVALQSDSVHQQKIETVEKALYGCSAGARIRQERYLYPQPSEDFAVIPQDRGSAQTPPRISVAGKGNHKGVRTEADAPPEAQESETTATTEKKLKGELVEASAPAEVQPMQIIPCSAANGPAEPRRSGAELMAEQVIDKDGDGAEGEEIYENGSGIVQSDMDTDHRIANNAWSKGQMHGCPTELSFIVALSLQALGASILDSNLVFNMAENLCAPREITEDGSSFFGILVGTALPTEAEKLAMRLRVVKGALKFWNSSFGKLAHYCSDTKTNCESYVEYLESMSFPDVEASFPELKMAVLLGIVDVVVLFNPTYTPGVLRPVLSFGNQDSATEGRIIGLLLSKPDQPDLHFDEVIFQDKGKILAYLRRARICVKTYEQNAVAQKRKAAEAKGIRSEVTGAASAPVEKRTESAKQCAALKRSGGEAAEVAEARATKINAAEGVPQGAAMADDAALIERRKMAIEQFEGTVEEQLVKMSAAEIDGNSAAEDAARSAGLSAAECVNQLKAMTPQEFKTWEQAKRPKYELEVKKVHGLRVELQKLTVERDQMELEKASDSRVVFMKKGFRERQQAVALEISELEKALAQATSIPMTPRNREGEGKLDVEVDAELKEKSAVLKAKVQENNKAACEAQKGREATAKKAAFHQLEADRARADYQRLEGSLQTLANERNALDAASGLLRQLEVDMQKPDNSNDAFTFSAFRTQKAHTIIKKINEGNTHEDA
jgi:hypothetical protein